jgi:hypothetical protein
MIEPEEAEWVKSIWEWYANGIGTRDIRQMLISAGANQRVVKEQGVPWRLSVIYRILHNESYHTGLQIIEWDGRSFEIPLPPIVDGNIAQCVLARLEKNKAHPARNLKNDYLALGLVYCASCGVKMLPKTFRKRENGKYRKTPTSSFRCSNHALGYAAEGCARTIGMRKLDDLLWKKVWDTISSERFEEILQERIEKLQLEEVDAESECARLEQELDDLTMERQKVIAWARKAIITEADLQAQLSVLSLQETELRRELAEKRLLTGNRAGHLLDLAREYRQQVSAGWEVILSGVAKIVDQGNP